MQTNPYSPPRSNVDTREFKPGKWYLALLVGFLVDVLGTITMSLLLGMGFTFYYLSNGMSADEVRDTLLATSWDSPLRLVSMIFGLLFSVLGGYLCARIANRHEYRYAAILAIISIVLGLLMAQRTIPITEHVLLGVLSFATLLGGAYLHVSAKQRILRQPAA